MKKIIQSDLISIAHRILKLNDKSDIATLLKETQLLHQKLVLLQFYEENKFRLDAQITPEKLVELADDFNTNNTFEANNIQPDFSEELIEETIVSTQNIQEDTVKVDDILTPEPIVVADLEVEPEAKPIDFEDEITELPTEPTTLEIDPVYSISHNELFNANEEETAKDESFTVPQHFVTNQTAVQTTENYHQIPVNKSINDAFANKISISLNDRIAFEKNLFNGNSDDLNRVISQLNTIETYQEAKDFIDDLVKPEFNNWKGKEDYESRFMQLVEMRFL